MASIPERRRRRSLRGLRMLEASRVLAVPLCGALLGAMGVEVTKLEDLPRLDMYRRRGPYIDGKAGIERIADDGADRQDRFELLLRRPRERREAQSLRRRRIEQHAAQAAGERDRAKSRAPRQRRVHGVFDRFPSLRFYFAELNVCYLPAMLFYLDRNYHEFNDWFHVELKKEPSEYVLQHALFGMIGDAPILKMGHVFPLDQLVWGSDFPSVNSQVRRVRDEHGTILVTTAVLPAVNGGVYKRRGPGDWELLVGSPRTDNNDDIGLEVGMDPDGVTFAFSLGTLKTSPNWTPTIGRAHV